MSDAATRLPLSDLRPKMQIDGVIKQVEVVGAIVDIGAERDGLLHLSQIGEGSVRNVRELLNEGQAIRVWIQRIEVEKGRIHLTSVEPPALAWHELSGGQVHQGEVVRIEKWGVFVDIGAERPGLVHISELSVGFVESPRDVVQKGDVVEVKILEVNRKKRQIDLSMKALMMPEEPEPISSMIDDDEDAGDLPTAMELAFRRAIERDDDDEGPRTAQKRGRDKRDRQRQDDIIRRTLEQSDQD
ncbi:MAG: S1 RNA-binding domain-containing protein [Chloroflexi bacterium]|nr:S1 RNA-binding domain-containing protein [Chloroflexota bacterium]